MPFTDRIRTSTGCSKAVAAARTLHSNGRRDTKPMAIGERNLYPLSFSTPTQALEIPAPLPHSVRASVTSAGWLFDSQCLAEQLVRAQADRPFKLGGEQGSKHQPRELQNTPSPCAFDPTPFTLPTSIILKDRVCLKYQDVLEFWPVPLNSRSSTWPTSSSVAPP